MSLSSILKLLSIIFIIAAGEVQASDNTMIDSSSLESNIQNLSVFLNSSTVRLRSNLGQESPLIAEIPLNMIIGGALTREVILERLHEGNILVVHKNESGHITLFLKRNRQTSNAIHLGTYDADHASTRLVSAGSGCDGCPKGGRLPPRTPDWNPYANK